MAAKLPISFDDVESILKSIECSIWDKLPVLNLLPYVSCSLTPHSKEKIKAHATQHGEPTAASTFFYAVRVRPDAFLRMVIGLKKINPDLYQTVWKIIRKHFSKREDKMKALEDWVEQEYEKLIGNNESDDENGKANDEGAEESLYVRPSMQMATGPPDRQPTAVVPGAQQMALQYQPPAQVLQHQQISQGQLTLQIQQRDQPQLQPCQHSSQEQDACIDNMHCHSFSLVAQELEKPSNDHDGKIGWVVLITENKDIPISRKDQRCLAESRTPGTDLLDLLASRNCTVSNLGAWLKNCGLHDSYRKFADNLSVVCSNNPGARPTLLPPPYDKNEEENENICQQNQPSRHIHLQSSASGLPCQILTKKASNSKVLNNLEPVVQHGEPADCNENNTTDRSVDPLIEGQSPSSRSSNTVVSNVEDQATDMEGQDKQDTAEAENLPRVFKSSLFWTDDNCTNQGTDGYNLPAVVPSFLQSFSDNQLLVNENDSEPSIELDDTEIERTDIGGQRTSTNMKGDARNIDVSNNDPEEENIKALHVED